MTDDPRPGEPPERAADLAPPSPGQSPATETEPTAEGPARTRSEAWRRLGSVLHPRATRRQVVVGVLCVVLGFALVAAVRGNTSEAFLANARQQDLVRVLDDLGERAARLEVEERRLTAARDRLASGSEAQALAETQRRADALAVLAGTVPVAGPGVEIAIGDPSGALESAVLLDAVQELRDAGAEAIQIAGIRVIVSTWFSDLPGGGLSVSGTRLASPYLVRAIGDSQTLATAMAIPGGVSDSVKAAGGTIAVTPRDRVEVTAVVPLSVPEYARPAPSPSG